MERRSLLRFMFLLFTIFLLLLFTLLNFPYPPPPNTAELLDCATSSPWCTSKNRFRSRKPNLKQNPTHSTRRHHSDDVPRHPLDPLTVQEFNRVRAILQSHAPFKNSQYALHSISLEEPEKPAMLTWRNGDALPRRKAGVIARVDGVVHVLTVDIESGEMTRHETGQFTGYPIMTVEDMTSAMWAPLASKDFNRTIMERGIDFADLACLPMSTGWYGKTQNPVILI